MALITLFSILYNTIYIARHIVFYIHTNYTCTPGHLSQAHACRFYCYPKNLQHPIHPDWPPRLLCGHHLWLYTELTQPLGPVSVLRESSSFLSLQSLNNLPAECASRQRAMLCMSISHSPVCACMCVYHTQKYVYPHPRHLYT